MTLVTRLLCLAAAMPLASCGGNDCCTVQDAAIDAPADAPADAMVDPYAEVARIPLLLNNSVDLLFVVDDSPSMLDKQTNLKNAFPAFVNELSTLETGLPSLHIGVVTTDVGTKGADDAVAGPGIGSGPGACSGNGKAGNLQTNGSQLLTGNFISNSDNGDGTRSVNYTGSLEDVFSAIASVGAGGCGFEQPLEAARRALDNNPTNAGFLRSNANLAIIIVSDEDDCSISHSTLMGSDPALGPLQSFRCTRFGVTCDGAGQTPDAMNTAGAKGQCHSNETSPYLADLARYETYFKSLKADPNLFLFASIAGNVQPFSVELRSPPAGGSAIPALAHSCTYAGAAGVEVADPAVRISELAGRFVRNSVSGICSNNISSQLVDIARQVRGLVGDTCITRAISTPYDCMVYDVVGSSSTQLPACNSGAASTNKPCHELITDVARCGSRPRVVVQRADAPSPSTVVVARCRV